MEFNENHLREMTETAERAKSNTHRIEEVEEDIKSLKNDNRTLYEMSANIKSLTDGVISIKSDIKDVKEDQGEMKNEIQELKLAPTRTKANWFDSIGKFVITAIGAGVLGFCLAHLFPAIFG